MASVPDRSLAAPANFRTNPVPGIAGLPSASLRSVPGLALGVPGAQESGFNGATTAALLGQFSEGLVRNQAGWPSQELVTQPHIVKPWDNGYHERIGRNQALFYRRDSAVGEVESIVTLPQMNEILRRAHSVASANGVLERRSLDLDTWGDMKAAIHDDLEDELDRKRRLMADGARDESARSNATDRFRNTNSKFHTTTPEYAEMMFSDGPTQFLRYLSHEGILQTWNYLGVARNIEHSKLNFKVLNAIHTGPYDVDNYWAGETMAQGQYVYLLLTRKYNKSSGQYEQFHMQPWCEPLRDSGRDLQSKYPTQKELYYEDEGGYGHYGAYFTIGKVARIVANAHGDRRRANVLAGLSESPNAEHDAWRETQRSKKQTIFLTIGRDPWDKSGL